MLWLLVATVLCPAVLADVADSVGVVLDTATKSGSVSLLSGSVNLTSGEFLKCKDDAGCTLDFTGTDKCIWSSGTGTNGQSSSRGANATWFFLVQQICSADEDEEGPAYFVNQTLLNLAVTFNSQPKFSQRTHPEAIEGDLNQTVADFTIDQQGLISFPWERVAFGMYRLFFNRFHCMDIDLRHTRL